MIAFLKGTIEDITENSLVLDVNGIGYEVLVPGQLLDMLEGIGQELKVYTYMQVREDAVVLFGFLTRDDLAMFKMLIGVNGVGPVSYTHLSLNLRSRQRHSICRKERKSVSCHRRHLTTRNLKI